MSKTINNIVKESLEKIKNEYSQNMEFKYIFWVQLEGKIELLHSIANDNKSEIRDELLIEIQNVRYIIKDKTLSLK